MRNANTLYSIVEMDSSQHTLETFDCWSCDARVKGNTVISLSIPPPLQLQYNGVRGYKNICKVLNKKGGVGGDDNFNCSYIIITNMMH